MVYEDVSTVFALDMDICVTLTPDSRGKGDKLCGMGSLVIPEVPFFDIHVKAKEDMSLFVVESKHRYHHDNPRGDEYTYRYDVRGELESVDHLIQLGGFRKDGQHSWGAIAMQDSAHKEWAKNIYCNGQSHKEDQRRGTSYCQSKAGKIQEISFRVPMAVSTDPGCEIPVPQNGMTWRFEMPRGACVYEFMEPVLKRFHKFYTFGYDQVLIREID